MSIVVEAESMPIEKSEQELDYGHPVGPLAVVGLLALGIGELDEKQQNNLLAVGFTILITSAVISDFSKANDQKLSLSQINDTPVLSFDYRY